MYNVTGSYSVITQELLKISKQLGKVDKAENNRLLSNVFIHLENDREIPEVNFYTALNVSPLTTLLNLVLVVSGTSNINLISCLTSDKDIDKIIVSRSDDKNCLNAPLGERIYYFNKNDSQAVILNPVNQLEDAYNKLKLGLVANMSFYNPLFDNITYLAKTKSKDSETLIGATFYIEDNKLCMNVLDSASSLEELFSYKLSPLILIQSILANWIGKEVGTTNYLVTTLRISQDTMIDTSNYEIVYYDWGNVTSSNNRLGNKQDLSLFLDIFWSFCINDILASESEKSEDIETRLSTILSMYNIPIFWEDCLLVAYISRYIKLNNMFLALKHISELKCNDWKVSILRYIRLFINSENIEEYEKVVDEVISSYTLENKEVIMPGMIDCLKEYLKGGIALNGELKNNTRGATEFII